MVSTSLTSPAILFQMKYKFLMWPTRAFREKYNHANLNTKFLLVWSWIESAPLACVEYKLARINLWSTQNELKL